MFLALKYFCTLVINNLKVSKTIAFTRPSERVRINLTWGITLRQNYLDITQRSLFLEMIIHPIASADSVVSLYS